MKERWFNFRPLCLIFAFLLLGSVFCFYITQEIALTIQSYQNTPEQDKNEIEQKINALKEEIDSLKDQIEDNRAKANALWYGFHERL